MKRLRQDRADTRLPLLLALALDVALGLAASAAAPQGPSAGAGPAGADVATATEATVSGGSGFAKVIDHIRAAEASGAWMKAGWREAVIEQALAGIIEQMNQAAGRKDLALPVALANLRAGDFQGRGDHLRNALWVCRGGSVSLAEQSMILADGNVDVAFANDCVIVARGAVEIAHGANNVVLAGQYINVSHDGRPLRPGRGPAPSSLLVSGGYVDVAHAMGTVVSAPRLVSIADAEGVTLVNCPKADLPRHPGIPAGWASVNAEGVTLAPPAVKDNPLAGKLDVTQVVRVDDASRRFVVIDRGGAELVLRPGAEIRDGAGRPVPELSGWHLTFVADEFALFSRGNEDAGFLVPKRQGR